MIRKPKSVLTCFIAVYSILFLLVGYTLRLEVACVELTRTVEQLKKSVKDLQQAPRALVSVEDGELKVEIPK